MKNEAKIDENFDEFKNCCDEIYREVEVINKEMEKLKTINGDYRRYRIDNMKLEIDGINSCYTDEIIDLRNKKKSFILDSLDLIFNFKSLISILMINQNFHKLNNLKTTAEINDFNLTTENQFSTLVTKDNQD
jgi:hypothetical protein